jgi:hypothetical protein
LVGAPGGHAAPWLIWPAGLLSTLEYPEDHASVVHNRSIVSQGLSLLCKAASGENRKTGQACRQAHSVVEALAKSEREQRRLRATGGMDHDPSVAEIFKSVASGLNNPGPAPPPQPVTSSAQQLPVFQPVPQRMPPQAPHPVPAGEFDTDSLLRQMGLLVPDDDGSFMGEIYMPFQNDMPWTVDNTVWVRAPRFGRSPC